MNNEKVVNESCRLGDASSRLGEFSDGVMNSTVVCPECGPDQTSPTLARIIDRSLVEHVTLVRMLSPSPTALAGACLTGEVDLAVRDGDRFVFREDLLSGQLSRLGSMDSITLVPDDMPTSFSSTSIDGRYGNVGLPDDMRDIRRVGRRMTRTTYDVFGAPGPLAPQLRFRLGTESQAHDRFGGVEHVDYTQDYIEYFEHLEEGALEVDDGGFEPVFGLFNHGGGKGAVGLGRDLCMAGETHPTCTTNSVDVALVAETLGSRVGFIPVTMYATPEDSPTEFVDKVTRYFQTIQDASGNEDASWELHEYNIRQPHGNDKLPATGAYGAAYSAQVLLRLYEAGLDRSYHWATSESVPSGSLLSGLGWVHIVLESLVDERMHHDLEVHIQNESANCPLDSGIETHAVGFELSDGGRAFLISTQSPEFTVPRGRPCDVNLRVVLPILEGVGSWDTGRTPEEVHINEFNAVYDRLHKRFAPESPIVSWTSEMGVTDEADLEFDTYDDMMRRSLSWAPDLRSSIETDTQTLSVKMKVPEVRVVHFPPALP